ncbi:Glucose-methanol-choline (GMC) oxidoreductase:NAD binding site [Actinokineospora spheciospongiae]|uniref:Glucose-methanol-choline (GMC) oxidoreductase:NAD binding site n=1 Tax=Actinokineospora spheciospongiae TaxID=909613 RepID=W7IPG5_9PSEU|nr:GMC family oxidoreductase N-terminal domain-containing protein [Actinokineospora spheciospongiae]EWC58607.1 Glucose-methanol-choline (GMC) oxidoreductase:NAD binding site [Actinokineospora spheciospongiae]PWW59436.1 choline dehydrogenase-like flavoprotein [Actinokineospora spheciospongiae]
MRDVVVVGSGGGGPVVAKELAGRGLDVLVLEAGARHLRPEQEWTRLEDDANNPITGVLRVGPSRRSEAPWLRDFPQNSFVWQIAGVGGTTLHYFGNCPRPPAGVFAGYDGPDKAEYDTAHLFPFGYDEFRPYLEWVEQTLPVQTAPMGTKESFFFRGAEGLGLAHQTTKDVHGPAYRAQENCILQPQGTAGRTNDRLQLLYPDAQGCTFCGHCFQGCVEPRQAPRNLKARRSTDNSYVPMMLTADAWSQGGKAAELITDAYVVKVLMSNGEARGVVYRTPDGALHTVEAKVVVLSGGCVENPRLWFNSGLPNPNDWVGRGLTEHHLDWVFGEFDSYVGSSRGAGSNVRCDFPGYGGVENVCLPPALQSFAMTFSDSGISGVYDNDSGVGPQGADTLGRLVGNDLKGALSKVDNLLTALVVTDDDVQADNRVTLSSVLPSDEHGRVARVEIQHRKRTARTRRNRDFLAARSVELMRAAGARAVHRMDWAPLLLHVQSSMRMGLDPATSVLDSDGQARFVPRLFIADNSALANSAGGANPTLTSQALATRTAEKIFQTWFGGDPWVAAESPTSSIDDRVTAAVLDRGL